MDKILNDITTSDVIAVISIIVSLGISTFSFLHSNKIIKDSLKPDIKLYLDYLSSNSIQYLIIKNFGKTGTKVLNIKHNLPENNFISQILQSSDFIYLAPNQVLYFPFKSGELKETYKIKEIEFEFEYKFGLKTIKEKQTISLFPSPIKETYEYDKEQALNQIYIALNRLIMK